MKSLKFNLNYARENAVKYFLIIAFALGAVSNIQAQTLDAFDPNANVSVDDIEYLPDGKLLVCGQFTTIGGQARRAIARLNADGTFDATFPVVDTAFLNILDAVIQPDGKILISGGFSTINGVARVRVARLNSDGTLDTGFDVGLTPPIGSARLGLLPDGKILVPANAGNGINRVLRRNSNGSADASFASPIFDGTIAQVTAQTDGKVIVVGGFTMADDISRFGIARLNANGSLDTSFNANSNSTVFLVTLAPDGKIYAGGGFTSIGGQTRSYFARLNADGSADATFQNPQIVGTGVRPSILLPDGKVMIAGNFDTVGGAARRQLARLNADGTLDTTFRNMQVGVDSLSSPNMIKRQPDGKILVVGNFTTVDGQTRNRLARITPADAPTVRAKFDFDGDAKADVSVFRPAEGAWYLLRSTQGFTGITFGASTDKVVPADYDGDGKTDVAVYRDGTWYLNRSTAGFTGITFGLSTDIPVPADFDGDGKAELCVFRPSNGGWYQYNLATNLTNSFAFGQAGDNPVPADYDGDGRADIAVFRGGTWYIQRSQLGFTGIGFGAATDKPVPADYDADGKTDVAVFRDGIWYLLQSTAGFTGITFGLATDLPVPADYDGDGKADVAVFRNGTWYLNRSTAGFTGVTFGAATDKPIPNAFVP